MSGNLKNKSDMEFYFILNKDRAGDEKVTHAVLNGKIVSDPKGWDAYNTLELAVEKLKSPEIQQQMKELGIEMEIVQLQ